MPRRSRPPLFPPRITSLDIVIALYVLAPSALLFLMGGREFFLTTKIFLVLLYSASIFLCAIFLLLVTRGWLRLVVVSLLSMQYLLLAGEVCYVLYMKHTLDLFAIADSSHEVLVTVFGTLGVMRFSFLLVVGVLFLVITAWLFSLAGRFFECYFGSIKRPGAVLLGLLPLAAIIWSIPHLHASLLTDTTNIAEIRRGESGIYFPLYEDFHADSDDNFFILQLESFNSLALNGKAVVDGEEYKGNFMPTFRSIAKDGIIFPFFFANGVMTTRAQEAILCGITNNFLLSLDLFPEFIQSNCIAKTLKNEGFKTFYLSGGHLDKETQLTFAKKTGFEDVHWGNILPPGTPDYFFGYDDCDYYTAAFDYLRKHDPDPKRTFVYFQVVSNHYGFEQKEEYASLDIFKDPKNQIEHYINSALAQDYCLGRFYDEYMHFAPENTHLIIVGDHSFPQGINGSTDNLEGSTMETFLTSLLYVPPRRIADQFQIGKTVHAVRYAQTDIFPTILSLLGPKQYPNSFAFELRKEQDSLAASLLGDEYEDCQVLVQPYDGGYLSFVRGNDKFTYSIAKKTLLRTDIKADLLDLHPTLLRTGLSFEEFQKEYQCNRYR